METWQRLFSKRTERMKASDIREAFKLAERGDIISFAGGFPAPETFPTALIAEVAHEVASRLGASSLQYGPTEGLYELRESVAQRLRGEGIECTAENVLLTNGSQQALDLVGKVTIDPGDTVIVEKPGYIGGISAFNQYEPSFTPIPLDSDGIRVDELERVLAQGGPVGGGPVKLCYVVPNFHNPTGVTLSEDRRERLAELAREYGFCVIEDNPYGDLRFDGAPRRHIRTYDSGENVLYLGTFSKVFLPGFRIGYVVGPEPVIQKLAISKQGADLCSNSFGQRIILECARRGLIDKHVKSIIDVYRKKRDLMLRALAEHFPDEVEWTYPEGGFFVWVTLPEEMDAKALLPRAVATERVAYVSGGASFVDGSGKNTIRLAYSQASDEDIEEGIRRLGRFLKGEALRMRANAPDCGPASRHGRAGWTEGIGAIGSNR